MGQLKDETQVADQDLKVPLLLDAPVKKSRSIGQWFKDELEYRRNAISGMDNMFLQISRKSKRYNPVCISVSTYTEDLDFESLMGAWENMISRYPRYRQRLTNLDRRLHAARLVDVEDFNVRNCFTVEHLPDGANGKRALENVVGDFSSRGWDYEKPMWEAKLIRNYTDEQGAKCAVVVRAHHTLADGQGYVISQLTTCTSSPTEPLEKSVKTEAELKEEFLKRAGLWKDPAKNRVPPPIKYAKAVLKFVGQVLFFIFALLYGFVFLIYNNYMLIAFRPRALRYDGDRLKGREYAFSKEISITDIKLCQKAYKSKGRKITLNDVMSAVVARGMTKCFKEVGEPIDSRVSFFVPLSTRMPWDMSMGNYSTGLIAFLKCDSMMSHQQLIDAAHDEMNTIKKNIWPRIGFKLLSWVNFNVPGLFPSDEFNGKFLDASYGLFTNVPGPTSPIYQGGVELKRWLACPPQLGNGTLGIGMITYKGNLSWTILADKYFDNKADIAHKLADSFIETFNEFLDEAKTLTKGE